MSPTRSFASAFGLMALGARSAFADCLSFGMDFQNGGSYFQNSLSNDSFTFVSQFEGCNSDTAFNTLIDDSGDQWLCSDTMLTPDDQNMLSTCPVTKNQLASGNYSIVIMSNNGKGDSADPVAYERDFMLSVGPQSTSTFTPTLTVSVSTTPIVTVTGTTTSTTTTVLSPSTVTSPSTTITPTKTVTPKAVTTTSTKALFTVKFTSYKVDIHKATKTITATCKTPTRQPHHDPTAKIRITVGPAATLAVNSAKFRREIEEEKRRFVEARAARLAGRAPDPQPLIVTDTNTADWTTVSSTVTASTATITATTEVIVTATSTPPPITVLKGKTTASAVTTTAATPTKTKTQYNIATSVTTKTIDYDYTITTRTTPAALKTACKSAGGIIR